MDFKLQQFDILYHLEIEKYNLKINARSQGLQEKMAQAQENIFKNCQWKENTMGSNSKGETIFEATREGST